MKVIILMGMLLIVGACSAKSQVQQHAAASDEGDKLTDSAHWMDASDQLQVANALETLSIGASTVWVNPDTNNSYQLKPLKIYHYNRSPCREYIITATVKGQQSRVHGKACRQADGSWKVIQSQTIKNQ